MNQQTRILELEITQNDIFDAVRESRKPDKDITTSCVVSVAARRQEVENFHASAGGLLCNHTGDGMWYSPEAKKLMSAFDNNYRWLDSPVKPCKLIFTEWVAP